MTIYLRSPEVEAILDQISDLPVPVGYSARPTVDGVPVEAPFVVVYPSIIPLIDGPIDDLHADTDAEYLIHSIGETAEQAVMVSDRVRLLMLAPDFAVTGRALRGPVRWVGVGPLNRDDDTFPALSTVGDFYTIPTTPIEEDGSS